MKTTFEIYGSKGQIIAIMKVKVLKNFFSPAPEVVEAKIEQRPAINNDIMAALAMLTRKETPAPVAEVAAPVIVSATVAEVITPAPARKAGKDDKVVIHTDVKSRWDEKRNEKTDYTFHAEINLTAKTIRIHGTKEVQGKRKMEINTGGNIQYGPASVEVLPFDRTFAIGDRVEYGSYNLIYTGPIVAITPQGVKVQAGGVNQILKMYDFIWRNWDLDLEKIAERNANWMD